MRIFYVAAFADPTDSSWYSLGRMRKVQQVALALLALDHKPELLNIAPLPAKAIKLSATVLPVKRLCTISILPLRFIQLFCNSVFFFSSAGTESLNSAIWLYNTRLAESVVAFVALLIRPQLKLILQLEDLPSARLANHGFRGYIDRLTTACLSRRADCVFAVSKHVARAYSRLVKVPTESITVLPPTLDPLFLNLAQTRTQPFSSPCIQIFYAGSFAEEKGVFDLIEAFLAMRSLTCKLLLAGSAPKSLVQAYRLNTSIHFLGIVSNYELFKLYTSVDVVVNPHRPILNSDHVFPFKLIETVASGALPLTTPVPGAEDLGLPSECFFHDVKSLSSKLVNAPALWKSTRRTIESASQSCRIIYSFENAKATVDRALALI